MEESRLSVKIRTGLKPGDLGWILYNHGVLYADEKGYDISFEKDIVVSMQEFMDHYIHGNANIWLAEKDDKIVGSIAAVPSNDRDVDLRWILVLPEARGSGIGTQLMEKMISYCQGNKWEKIHCRDVEKDSPGIPLYLEQGFETVSEEKLDKWGRVWDSIHYVLHLQ